MRQVLASVLLIGSLSGCLGQYRGEHIEAAYHSCLDAFQPLRGVRASDWDAMCERTRQAAYDYGLSVRRFAPQLQGTWSASPTYKAPTQVIIMP